jgi:hypothetical protein
MLILFACYFIFVEEKVEGYYKEISHTSSFSVGIVKTINLKIQQDKQKWVEASQ